MCVDMINIQLSYVHSMKELIFVITSRDLLLVLTSCVVVKTCLLRALTSSRSRNLFISGIVNLLTMLMKVQLVSKMEVNFAFKEIRTRC